MFDRRSIPPHARETMWSAADGWPIRRIDFSAKVDALAVPRGALLFLPGRGDHYEKYLKRWINSRAKAGRSRPWTGAVKGDRAVCWPTPMLVTLMISEPGFPICGISGQNGQLNNLAPMWSLRTAWVDIL